MGRTAITALGQTMADHPYSTLAVIGTAVAGTYLWRNRANILATVKGAMVKLIRISGREGDLPAYSKKQLTGEEKNQVRTYVQAMKKASDLYEQRPRTPQIEEAYQAARKQFLEVDEKASPFVAMVANMAGGDASKVAIDNAVKTVEDGMNDWSPQWIESMGSYPPGSDAEFGFATVTIPEATGIDSHLLKYTEKKLREVIAKHLSAGRTTAGKKLTKQLTEQADQFANSLHVVENAARNWGLMVSQTKVKGNILGSRCALFIFPPLSETDTTANVEARKDAFLEGVRMMNYFTQRVVDLAQQERLEKELGKRKK